MAPAGVNWKTIAMPREVRVRHKRARVLKRRLRRRWAGLLLAGGWPPTLSRHLRQRELTGRVCLHKQGILSVAAGEFFLRYTRRPKSASKLEKEYAAWLSTRRGGFELIVPKSMRLHRLTAGLILESELLEAIDLHEQLATTLPIIDTIIAAASPETPPSIPATIEAALRFAKGQPMGKALDELEDEIRAAFSQPLLTGLSHQDLHFRNVMRDRDGRPVLIDLKSCVDEQILALDLLGFVCKYRASRDGYNLVDQALDGHDRDWRWPELASVLDRVDLPRRLWGPIVALHTVGRVLEQGGGGQADSAAIEVMAKIESSFRSTRDRI